MEKFVNGNETLPGKGNFVAAFASTNLGDVSPNTNGPRCQDTGKFLVELCISFLFFFLFECLLCFCVFLSLPSAD